MDLPLTSLLFGLKLEQIGSLDITVIFQLGDPGEDFGKGIHLGDKLVLLIW